MIRPMTVSDVSEIVAIYAHYVNNTVVTFDTEVPSETEMCQRLCPIMEHYPAWVYVEDGKIAGYCYAHKWKTKKAYRSTVETTIYLHPDYTGKGYGRLLMNRLIEDCRNRSFHALVACITIPKEPSVKLHERLNLKQVSCFHEVGRKFNRWLDVADYELIFENKEATTTIVTNLISITSAIS